MYLITFTSLSYELIYPNAVCPVPTVCCNIPPTAGVPEIVENLIDFRAEKVLPV